MTVTAKTPEKYNFSIKTALPTSGEPFVLLLGLLRPSTVCQRCARYSVFLVRIGPMHAAELVREV